MTTFHELLTIFNSIEVHPVTKDTPVEEILVGMISIAQATGRPVAYVAGKLAVTPSTTMEMICRPMVKPDPTDSYHESRKK